MTPRWAVAVKSGPQGRPNGTGRLLTATVSSARTMEFAPPGAGPVCVIRSQRTAQKSLFSMSRSGESYVSAVKLLQG
jgi:hypothetical protein